MTFILREKKKKYRLDKYSVFIVCTIGFRWTELGTNLCNILYSLKTRELNASLQTIRDVGESDIIIEREERKMQSH